MRSINLEIPPQPQAALSALEARGFEAFLVGGCVRDSVMGLTPHDYDITTSALPEQIAACFDGYHIITNGIKHGTVTVVIDRMPVEITTYRLDGDYADHRHPDSVQFSQSLQDDLARRDFTINAMAYNATRGLVDLYGGCGDIDALLIRCVGDAKLRFGEDALRMLRAVRFAVRFGFEIERGTLDAINQLYGDIRYVAVERIYAELTKALSAPHPGAVLNSCKRLIYTCLDIAEAEMPGESWSRALTRCDATEPDPALRLCALLYELDSARIEGICHRLKPPMELQRRVVQAFSAAQQGIPACSAIIKTNMSVYGDRAVIDALKLLRADAAARCDASSEAQVKAALEACSGIIDRDECRTINQLAVNGSDLKALGITGQGIGATLRALLNSVINGSCPNERAALLELAAAIAKR